jgi:Tfp pilus assembly protein PilE
MTTTGVSISTVRVITKGARRMLKVNKVRLLLVKRIMSASSECFLILAQPTNFTHDGQRCVTVVFEDVWSQFELAAKPWLSTYANKVTNWIREC